MIEKPEKQRLDFLDALRGIAIIAVFIVHALSLVVPKLNDVINIYFRIGSFGVFLFFLVSGFIIPASIERQNSLGVFWIRRICRLYPLYWFSILIVILGYYLNLPYKINLQHLEPNQLTANMTMLQYIIGYKNITDLFWTLEYEMVFYIVISCIFILGLFRRALTIIFSSFAVAICTDFIAIRLFNIQIADQLLYYLATMFTGMAFYRYYDNSISKKTLCVVLICSIFMMIITIFGRWDYEFAFYLFITRIIGLSVFVLLFSLRYKTFPHFIKYIGKISYSIYLLHIIFIYTVPKTSNVVLTLVLWIITTLVLASVTYYLIERPMIRLGHYLTTGFSPKVYSARSVD